MIVWIFPIPDSRDADESCIAALALGGHFSYYEDESSTAKSDRMPSYRKRDA